MRKRRVFIDLDGVVVDFDAAMTEHGLSGDELKVINGAYLKMKPIEGALDAVREVIGLGYDVFIATKPPTGYPQAYAEKAEWVLRYLPELSRKIIITHDKGLLGDRRDILCDDRPHKANCFSFQGMLLRFESGYHWDEALIALHILAKSDRQQQL